MATIDESKIQAIIEEIQRRTSAVLLRSADQMARLSARETVALLRRSGYKMTDEEQQALIDRVVKARMDIYSSQIQAGGSECVERVLTVQQDGSVKATTAVRFVPWLADKNAKESEAIISLIRRETIAGQHPFRIADQLRDTFKASKHSAELVSRTESAKIRADTKFDMFRDQDVHYVKYKTAGDSRVRPEHAMRDGKIYRIEDCPYLGEYNCRCTTIPADYFVRKGAKVEPSQAEILTPEQAGL